MRYIHYILTFDKKKIHMKNLTLPTYPLREQLQNTIDDIDEIYNPIRIMNNRKKNNLGPLGEILWKT